MKPKLLLLIFFMCSTTIFTACHLSGLGQGQTILPNQTDTQKIVVNEVDDITVDGISETAPDVNIDAIDRMIIQKTADEQDSSLLIRMSLPVGIRAEDISSSYLRLKRSDGDKPSLLASAVIPLWSTFDVTWNKIHEIPPADVTMTGTLDGDWYVIDVTSIVKRWYSGDYANYGFLVNETRSGSKTAFFSPHNSSPDDYPELEINYVSSEDIIHNYEYVPQEDGNCFSYALRDVNPILATDIGIDDETLITVYKTDGLDGVLAYTQQLCLEYVNKYADSLGVESIREIPNFDAPTTDGEYRIALRVGVEENPDETLKYDFHFHVQMPDGSWAEKFGPSDSRLVPGSNLDLDPGLYPWDSNEIWGIGKFNGFYDSDTIFYAVKKNTTDFTNHTR